MSCSAQASVYTILIALVIPKQSVLGFQSSGLVDSLSYLVLLWHWWFPMISGSSGWKSFLILGFLFIVPAGGMFL
jgi:hypothetical protein